MRKDLRQMASSPPDDKDGKDLRSFLQVQVEALKSYLQSRHSLSGAYDLLCWHAGQVWELADRHSVQSISSGNGFTSGTVFVPLSSGDGSNSASGPGTSPSLYREYAPSIMPSDDIDQLEQSPSKRRKVSGIGDESDEEDEHRPLFVSREDDRDENSGIQKQGFGDPEEIEVKVEEDPYIIESHNKLTASEEAAVSDEESLWHETGDKQRDLKGAKGGGDDDSWIYIAGQPRKYCRTKAQEPKFMKAGRARRNFAVSVSDADDMKIIMDLTAWEEHEQTRKGGVGTLEPKEIYYNLKERVDDEGEEDEDGNHTAAQVALMILSLGSSQAIVELKRLIEDMRCVTQAVLARPPVKITDSEIDARLDTETRKEVKRERMIKLTQFVYNSTCEGTPLQNFQARYSRTNLCQFIITMRDRRMAQKAHLNEEDVQKWVYRKLIIMAYPKITRYRITQAGNSKEETSQFKERVVQLENNSKCGFRWLMLREKFGIGIMALYFHSCMFSVTARFSIDDHRVTQLEFDLMMSYLSEEGNPDSVWLSELCNLINAHMEQGAEGMLRLPEFFLEKWDAKQIMMCKERSAALSAMCETLQDRLMCPGNNVSEKAWLAVDRNTSHALWEEGVKKEAQQETHERERSNGWRRGYIGW